MTQTQAAHNPLLAELRWVHDMVRRDLATVRRLAADAARGAPAPAIEEGLRGLRTQGGLFQLRVNCLRYCRFVHEHHTNEDVALFPAVRRAAPQLAATVDRLEADHRAVAGLLDEIEAAAGDLAAAGARTRLVEALDTLSAHLLAHLAFEEEALAPVLATWTAWPFHG
ncbi:hemerythrin domain-containing protein [Dactylosporangium aurantiacum]|uniref:Hemerythrin domain-containing protein n=1 Tax=Dactylosporangium aurantiacum TaxID=35754 RepID=A0A9Q9IFA5_9ACTN|nr:hemerythrin domain-containing protein [Dactylosporangium aurantiacum]MDG6102156.1 hemerythrin domain-containing protein [Dactylosporangium aurantiacum]UWZ53523.1 hemerythrin domain-containing protein [Dactylosporangium aurantiacum]